jgi:hypothetical protein
MKGQQHRGLEENQDLMRKWWLQAEPKSQEIRTVQASWFWLVAVYE